MKTCCCSSHCKRYFDCQLADINNEGMNIVNNYHEWGSGTFTDEGCVIEHYCGELGDYKMFEPVKKRGLRSSVFVIDDICDVEPEVIRCIATNAWDDYINTKHLKT